MHSKNFQNTNAYDIIYRLWMESLMIETRVGLSEPQIYLDNLGNVMNLQRVVFPNSAIAVSLIKRLPTRCKISV
jgi:hypothetical protein